MKFGDAVEYMQEGYALAREGWNGKNMWVSYSPGCDELPGGSFWSEAGKNYASTKPNCVVKVLPCLIMRTATGEILMGWLASQTDMLAEDWRVVRAT